MLSVSANVRELWTRFAAEFGAEIRYNGEPNATTNDDVVSYRHSGVAVTLDFFTDLRSSETRIYVPYGFTDDFNFMVTRAGFGESFFRFFRNQDVGVGDKEFDAVTIIKSRNVQQTNEFFADAEIRKLTVAVLRSFPVLNFLRAGQSPRSVGGRLHYLQFVEVGVIHDINQLRDAFNLMIAAVDRLKEMGVLITADGNP